MTNTKTPNPLDELLRARLRMPEAGALRIGLVRKTLGTVDAIARMLSGHPFFALRETEEILMALDGRTGVELLQALLEMNGGTEIIPHGLENIPKTGPVVIGSTHPIGTFDFIAHASALFDHRPDIKVVAGRETERFLGSQMLIPVDLDKRDRVFTARQTRAGMIDHLENDGALVIFGSGRVPREENGLLVEPPWRNGTTQTSAATGAVIVPASLDMRNTPAYYRTRKVAALLSGGNDEFGRKIASLRYVTELIAKLGGRYDVYYGPPQPPGTEPQKLKQLCESLVPGLYQR